jgi:hypothetical protein
MAVYIVKGRAMAYFYLAECSAHGHGSYCSIQEAAENYSMVS